MKKTKIILIIFFVILFFISYFWGKKSAPNFISYKNRFYGFSLNLPLSWEGKFVASEEEFKTEFLYLRDVSNPIEIQKPIFQILVFHPLQWNKIKQEPSYSGEVIYEDNDLVFVYTLPLENPYSDLTEYKKEAEEFQKMVGEVKEIISTFKFSKEKILCAKELEKINKNPLVGPINRKCCPNFIEWRESKSYSFCIKPTSEGIIIESPKENEKIKSPLKIVGQARGFWFFESQFSAELYDENENLLGTAILTAKGDWMTENFVPFEGELEFFQPETQAGKLRFLSSNPSGLAENQKIFEINVQFEKEQVRKVLLFYYNPEKDKDETGNIKCSRDGLVAIEKEIPLTNTPIQDTIRLLLKGKENLGEKEIQQGITTEYPLEGFKLKSANLKDDGTLILEFEDPFNKTIGGACRAGILWFQIEETAKQFPQIKEVKFLPEELFQP